MSINPYQSPQSGEPFVETGMGNSDPVVRLLVEIRDAQQESLELQREALQRVARTGRFFYARMIIPFVIIVSSFVFVTRLTRFAPPTVRPVPRAAPATFPNPPMSPPTSIWP